jgi:hypothetical protein
MDPMGKGNPGYLGEIIISKKNMPFGYVKIASENGHRNSGFIGFNGILWDLIGFNGI